VLPFAELAGLPLADSRIEAWHARLMEIPSIRKARRA
jgi:hypothetical protein